MATRMQQRRGTAQQWTDADPILAAGEIGFETDTNQFKIGDGVNAWSDLSYFKNLEDLGGSLDDYVPLSTKGQPDGVATLDVNGHIPFEQLVNLTDGAPELLNTLGELVTELNTVEGELNGMINAHAVLTENVHGIVNTADIIYQINLDGAIAQEANDRATAITAAVNDLSGDLNTHNSTTENVHGIADTTQLVTSSDMTDAITGAISTHESDTSNVHGIADTTALATKSYADTAATNAQAAAEATAAADATTKAGAAQTAAEATAAGELSTHASDTTSVHGIADTSALALTADVNDALALKQDKVTGVSDTEIGYLDGVTSAIQTQIDSKASSQHTHSQQDITNLTDDLAAKAPLANPTFTGTVNAVDIVLSGNLTVSGTTTTVDTQDLVVSDPMIYVGEGNTANLVDLGFVSSFDNGTYQHSGLVRDASDGKWKLFKGVTDEPTTTINFSQGSMDDLKVGALEATTVTPSSGVVFTDGTQTKEGVASRTPIIQKTSSYQLSSLTERDSLIEFSGQSGMTITVPADSTLDFPIGTSIDILQTASGQVTVAGSNGVTVTATPGLKLRTTWSSATLFKRAANTWVVMGDLSA